MRVSITILYIQCHCAECRNLYIYYYAKCRGTIQLPGPGNTKGECITVLSTSCLTYLDLSVLEIKTKIVSCHTADSKPVKQEVNGTVILPPLVFPAGSSVKVPSMEWLSSVKNLPLKLDTLTRILAIRTRHFPEFDGRFDKLPRCRSLFKITVSN
jgi:hypothetical protein